MSSISPHPPSPPPPDLTTHADVPPFPLPSTFSLLPDLYLLLSRLAPLQQLPSQSQSTSSTLPAAISPTSTPLPASEIIDPKSLPTHIYAIKQKINAARSVIEGLPDVQRSIAEQEREIESLEESVRGLRGRLGELGDVAGRSLQTMNRRSEAEREEGVRKDEEGGMQGREEDDERMQEGEG